MTHRPMMRVVEITTEQTYPLRLAVLRDNDPTRSVTYPEDGDPDAFHLGVIATDGEVVATSTWVPRPLAGAGHLRAVQLRGMATAAHLQGSGLGGMLLESGAATCRAAGFDVLWAKARDTALVFYARHECVATGNGFVDETTALPHHIVVRHLAPPT